MARPRLPGDWTGTQADKAREWWRDGVCARSIGKRLGRTKNAVIGKADREGWGRHPMGHDPRATA